MSFNTLVVASGVSKKFSASLRASLTGTQVNRFETSKETSFKLFGRVMESKVRESSLEFLIPNFGVYEDILRKSSI
jgi:hypothetical protein